MPTIKGDFAKLEQDFLREGKSIPIDGFRKNFKTIDQCLKTYADIQGENYTTEFNLALNSGLLKVTKIDPHNLSNVQYKMTGIPAKKLGEYK